MSYGVETINQRILDQYAVISAAERKIKTLEGLKRERFVVEPSGGSILKFEKRFGSATTPYLYAAMRVGAKWYVTGATGASSYTWEALKSFIGDSRVWVARNLEEIPKTNG